MKVYRIAIDGTCYKPFICSGMRQSSLESLYYEMGYIISGTEAITSGPNSIYPRIPDDDTGFYYFIFLEDAIHFAVYSEKPSTVLKVMEFDFPEDVVYSLIGWGGYHKADGYNYGKRAETYISDSKIIGNRINNSDIDKNIKRRIFLEEFRKSILTLKNYHDNNSYKIEGSGFDEEKIKLLEMSDEELVGYIKGERYGRSSDDIYWWFRNTGFPKELIKTDAITQRSSMFLYSLLDKRSEFELPELPEIAAFNAELLAKNGLHLDYSKSGIDCRIDYTRLIEEGNYEKAKDLLKSYRG